MNQDVRREEYPNRKRMGALDVGGQRTKRYIHTCLLWRKTPIAKVMNMQYKIILF